ncbi:MAG TPA: tetratricopeptide repeat protein [Planktothrix sp.]|jgi:tetratricopeptide (TPR) repeat protein
MEAANFLERANHLYQQGRYSLAEKEYRAHLTQNPDSSYGHRRLAFALLRQGKSKEAMAEINKAIECNPADEWAHYGQANILKHCGKFKEAEASLKEALEIDPEEEEFYIEGSHLSLRQGKFDDAINRAGTALTLDPQDFRGHLYKAWGLFGKNRWKDAEPIVVESLRLKPDHADSHALRGHIYMSATKPTEAIIQFREALRLDPTSSLAREGLLKALRSRNPLYGVLAVLAWVARPRIPLFFGSATAVLLVIWIVILFLSSILQWIAPHLLNLCMRFDPIAKHALNEDEIFIANFLAAWLLASYAITAVMLFFANHTNFLAPTFFFLYGAPFLFCRVFEFPQGKYRTHAIIYAGIAAAIGLAGIVCGFCPSTGALSSVCTASINCSLTYLLLCLLMRLLHRNQARAY